MIFRLGEGPEASTRAVRELGGSMLTLHRASSVTIRRRVKVRAEANPFDPRYHDYFRRRRRAPRGIILGATA